MTGRHLFWTCSSMLLWAMGFFSAMTDIMQVNHWDFPRGRTKRMRTRLAIATFFLLFSIGLFLLPIIPVEGAGVTSAGHCPPIVSRWIDWESAGYHFFGLGLNLRIWTQHYFCQ